MINLMQPARLVSCYAAGAGKTHQFEGQEGFFKPLTNKPVMDIEIIVNKEHDAFVGKLVQYLVIGFREAHCLGASIINPQKKLWPLVRWHCIEASTQERAAVKLRLG